MDGSELSFEKLNVERTWAEIAEYLGVQVAFFVIILFFVVIVRFSIAKEYRPKMWMGPYGVVSGLSLFLLSGYQERPAVFIGLLSAVLIWAWLTMMEKTDGTVYWWLLLVPGSLIPVWLVWIFHKIPM